MRRRQGEKGKYLQMGFKMYQFNWWNIKKTAYSSTGRCSQAARTKKVKRKDSWPEVKSSPEKTRRTGLESRHGYGKASNAADSPREGASIHEFQVFSLAIMLFKTKAKDKSSPLLHILQTHLKKHYMSLVLQLILTWLRVLLVCSGCGGKLPTLQRM